MPATTSYLSNERYLDGGDSDGVKVFKIPRGNPAQAPVQALGGGQIVTYQENLSPALIAAITAAEQALTVGTTAGNGPATTDFLAAINKPTAQAGIGIHKGRISAANTLQFTFSNTTAGNLTPTANEVYNVVVLRGMPVHTESLTPGIVPANSTNETIFNLTTAAPTLTPTLNSKGGIAQVTVVNGGARFDYPPTLLVTDSHGGAGAVTSNVGG